jgi:hypothetical protein
MKSVKFMARLAGVLSVMFLFLAPLLGAPASAQAVSSVDFQKAMRKLWEDHVAWTRLYIISAANDLGDKDATAQRLLQNQVDIGNAIKPFYGDAAGDKLTALLKDHILGAVELLDAAKAGDNARVQAASAKWYANADEIAAFLSGANPKSWPLDQMKMMMKDHLDLTLAEATAILQKKDAEGVADYDKVHDEILQMADALSAGIMAQFPDKFVVAPQALPVTGGAALPTWSYFLAAGAGIILLGAGVLLGARSGR